MVGNVAGARAFVIKNLDGLGLTDQQRAYVEAYLSGSTKMEACRIAGYSGQGMHQVHRSPKVQAALALAVERYLVGELAPAAISVISEMLADKKTPAGARATLALGVLDRAGFDAKRLDRKAAAGGDVSSMTRSQLEAEIQRLASEIDNRMVDVTPSAGDGEPVSEPDTTQVIDLYE